MLIRHQVAGIKRALRAQHAGDAAEVPGGKLADRVIGMLAGDFLQRAQLFFHVKARGVVVIKNIVSQHAQTCGHGLCVPADHRFGVAALDQLLHLLRVMKAYGDVLLKVQPHLEGAQQPFVLVVLVGGEHMQLLIALAYKVHHLLLARQQRR